MRILIPCLLLLAACTSEEARPAGGGSTPPAAAASAAAVAIVGVGDWIADAGVPAALRLRGPAGAAVPWSLTDWDGAAVAAGTCTLGGDGSGSVSPVLAEGWYQLAAGAGTFGVVVRPPGGSPDPFFAIDAVLGELVRDPAERSAMAAMLPRLGLGMARERLHWYGVHPEPGRLVWEARFREESLRRDYAAAGVAVLEMSNHMPGWLGRVAGIWPQDHLRTAASWEAMTAHWRATTAAVETWNEPDTPEYAGDATPDMLAAHVRAVAWGVRRGAPAAQVCSSGFTYHMDDAYLRMVLANGTLAASDVLSYHDYRDPEALVPYMAHLRALLAEAGDPAIPVWITEAGRYWKPAPRPAAADDMQSARGITLRAVEARAAGVARYFAFALPWYAEGTRSYGMTGKERTPLRSLAAYSHAARRLAGLAYAGDLELPGSARTRVFTGGGRAVAVAALAAGARLAPPAGLVRSAHGLDGRRLAGGGPWAPSEGALFLELDPARMPAPSAGPAMALWQAAQAARPRPAPQPLQLQIIPVPGEVVPCQTRYTVAALPGGARLRLRLNNHGAAAAAGVALTLAAPDAQAVLDGATRTIDVAPGAWAEAEWRIRPGASGQWRIDGRSTGGAALAPVVFRVEAEVDGEALLAGLAPERKRLLTAAEWQRCDGNVVTTCAFTRVATAAGWRLGFDFKTQGNQNWAFPRVPLPADARFDRFDAVLVRARVSSPATVRLFAFEAGGGGNIGYFTRDAAMPSDGAWHWLLVRIPELVHCWAAEADPDGRLDPRAIDRISIGMNSQFSATNAIEFSTAALVRLGD